MRQVYSTVIMWISMKYNLPRGYLSYSAWQLWLQDKNRFRKKYYEGIDDFQTVETIFGKKIAKQLEKDGSIKGSEYRISVKLNRDIKLLGYLDEFDEETLAITEYKTGHKNLKGQAPWNNLKVRRHKQLVFYCLLVKLKFKKYNPKVKLKWLETRFKKETREFAGHVITVQTRELELTGAVEEFDRRVANWELQNLKKEVILAVKQISEDYTSWQKTKNKSSVTTSAN